MRFPDAATYADVDGCEDAGAYIRLLSQERETVCAKLQAAHDRLMRNSCPGTQSRLFAPVTVIGCETALSRTPCTLSLGGYGRVQQKSWLRFPRLHTVLLIMA